MQPRHPILMLCLLIGFVQFGNTQRTISGTVKDSTGAPLAFVSVLAHGIDKKIVFTGIDGNFSLTTIKPIDSLEFRYLGYKRKLIPGTQLHADKPLRIVLQSEEFQLPEARIVAGENPAVTLMRKVVKNRHRNNPEKRAGYQCLTYNKIVFDLLPDEAAFEKAVDRRDTSSQEVKDAIRKFEGVQRGLEQHHSFLMETATERSYLPPDMLKENVLLNRVSGTDYAGLVSLASGVQPFSFYGDYLQLLDRDFVNPVSPGSWSQYFFMMEDTLYPGQDTIWVLSFQPRKGKVFTALEGSLHVHSDGYAVQNVRAWPAKTGKIELRIEQSYEQIGRDSGDFPIWFPEQLNFELAMRKYPAPYLGLKAYGHSYIKDAVVQTDLKSSDFDPEKPIRMQEEAYSRSDSAWAKWQAMSPLTQRERQTYTWLDTIGDKKNFDLMFRVMDYSATGLFPIVGPVNLQANRLIRFNQFENVRLGIGLSTAQPRPYGQSRRVEFEAYGAYGVADKRFKGGGSVLWRLHRGRGTYLAVGAFQDLTEPGTLYELRNAALVNRALYARRMDLNNEQWVQLGSNLWKGALMRVGLHRQSLMPLYNYADWNPWNEEGRAFRFTEARILFRYAAKEKVKRFLGGEMGSIQKWPVLELGYSRGFSGLLDGEFEYDRFSAAVYQSVFIRKLGRCNWRIEVGYTEDNLPLSKVFTLNQSPGGTAWGVFTLNNTFQSLPDTMIASDRFVNFYLSQEIGPVLYQTKYSSPYLSLHQNISWGSLMQPERFSSLGVATATDGIFESGVQVDDLIRINYVNIAYLGIGGAVFYRWGVLTDSDWKNNITPRLSLRFSFL